MTQYELLAKLAEISPYAALMVVCLVCLYFIQRHSINALKEQNEKAIQEIVRAHENSMRYSREILDLIKSEIGRA